MRRTHRALAMLALSLSLAAATATVAAATTPSAVEDQHDRLLRNLQAGQAERTQAAFQLARSMERNLTPVPAGDASAIQPASPADLATPGNDRDVLATLLLSLVGGLVGGAAVLAGWTAATHRHRAVPTT